MSDENKKEEKILIFPNDATLSIEISGYFINRIKALLARKIESNKDLALIIEEIKKDNSWSPSNEEEFDFETILILYSELESAASKSDKVKGIPVDEFISHLKNQSPEDLKTQG